MSLSKSQFIRKIAETSGQSKVSVEAILTAMFDVCAGELRSGEAVSIPGIVKLRVADKPATPERQGTNPFTKAVITIPAKPASKKIKVSALKAVKDSLTST